MKGRRHLRRSLLLPLAAVYHLGVLIKNNLYDRGLLKPRHLNRPVISVGSLSAGGAGKTPVVGELVRLAKQPEIRADVLTRGFGRSSAGTLEVRTDAHDAARKYGDEPMELSRSTRVFVASSRYDAGLLAESVNAAVGHLLDDGFQHRKLARNLDLVLLTREDVADTLLPAGNLREPLSSLKRADIVVLREEEAEDLQTIVADRSRAEIWLIRRRLVLPQGLKRPFIFCGIARPHSFLAMIQADGVHPCASHFFPDHHFFTNDEICMLAARAREAGADSFLCTGKDFIKISAALLGVLEEVAPVAIALLSINFLDEEGVMSTLADIFRG